MAERILILGASARAAAASARRAGLEPFCIDLFADRDTRLLADYLRCPPEEYPAGLFRLAKQVPPMPWMYTGGLENYPDLVGELAKERELWGNGPDVLRRVRDPKWLSQPSLHDPVIHYPQVVLPGAQPPDSGNWLWKPLSGSGGRGIRFASTVDVDRISSPESEYFLHRYDTGRISGPARNAAVIFRNWRPIGFTHQLVGTPWLHAPLFGYAGSIRWVCSLREFIRFNYSLRGIRGIWGADVAVSPDSYLVLYEVNPRYPASAEVIELATNLSIFTGEQRGPGIPDFNPAIPIIGKAIYYAPHRLTIPASGPWDESLRHVTDVWRRPDFADIPHPGDVIEAGHPVLTILAEANSEEACLARLKSRAAELDQLFGFTAIEEPPCRP